jgi:hypothetical protein
VFYWPTKSGLENPSKRVWISSGVSYKYALNNLPNLKLEDENWKVRLIEEEFMKHMWDMEGKKNERLSG